MTFTSPDRTPDFPQHKEFVLGTATGAVPLLGHIPALIRDPLGLLASLPAHGDLVWVRLGPMRALVVCHPELTNQMLLNPRVFEKGGPFYTRAREFMGNGLAVCPHAEHRRQRRMVQPAFHHSRFEHYAAVMGRRFDEGTASWRDGQVLDVHPALMALTMRITASTIFDAPHAADSLTELFDVIAVVLKGMYRRMLTPPGLDRLPTPGKLRYDRAIIRLHEIAREFVAAYRRDNVDHHDLLSMLLAARDDDGMSLSDVEVGDQVVGMLVSGIETGAGALGWAMCALSRHPQVQRRLQDEVDAVLGGRTATSAELPALGYTRQVVTETLRRYPPGFMATRATTADTELGGHPISEGTIVIYSAHLLQQRAQDFPDPAAFDPDRWADGAPRPPQGAFVPFGAGSRICVAENFTMMMTILALASVAARWQLDPTTRTERIARPGAMFVPRGQRIRITTREPR